MFGVRELIVVSLILSSSAGVFGADVILNEYNAVAGSEFLNGGNSSVDIDGHRASDSYFGRVQGNGGDWFELVVITDHLDMRNWKLDIYESGSLNDTLNLTGDDIWADLRSGTIITVSEDLPSDISYNPAAGDWWINVQAGDTADGIYIDPCNFPVNSSNWQLKIRNSGGATIFGPAGEGISPLSGVGPTEIFRLEAHPSASITPASPDYDDGDDFSTFGSLNQWGSQDINQLRSVVPAASSITLLSPNGSETIMGGTIEDITWSGTGTIDNVLIEFSLDNGDIWLQVHPPNFGNTGSYNWLVPIPIVDSQQCLVRVANTGNLSVYDTSDAVFTLYECVPGGDLTGDCIINTADLAVMAYYWLECGNPYDPVCED